ASTNHSHASTHWNFLQRRRVNLLDEIQRLDNLRQIFTGNIHLLPTTKSEANEDRIKLFFEISNLNVFPDFDTKLELHAEALNKLDFLETYLRLHFIIGDTVSVQSAGLRLLFENSDIVTKLRQLRRATESRGATAKHGDLLAGFLHSGLQH